MEHWEAMIYERNSISGLFLLFEIKSLITTLLYRRVVTIVTIPTWSQAVYLLAL